MVSLSSITTEVRCSGEGPRLLMIQGLGTEGRAWDPIVDRLSGHVQCFTYDNRGVGSASDVKEPFSIDDLVEDAAELVDALGEGPVHVCGVSLGGGIAMRLAARHPDLVLSLALHSTTARPDARLLAMLDFRTKILDTGVAAELLLPFIGLWAWSPSEVEVGSKLAEGVVDMSRFSQNAYKWSLQAAREQWMTDEELANISSPTLITVGSDDIMTTVEAASQMRAAIPGARLVVVDGGGHAYYTGDPDAFATLQLGWVLRNA
jgi:pimeloyl-ACP methyl ester carboxylesterase